MISFLLPSFRAQAEFGKNKSRKFGRGGRFFRIFRLEFGFFPLGPRVYRLVVYRRNSGPFRSIPRHSSGSGITPVRRSLRSSQPKRYARRFLVLPAVEGFDTWGCLVWTSTRTIRPELLTRIFRLCLLRRSIRPRYAPLMFAVAAAVTFEV